MPAKCLSTPRGCTSHLPFTVGVSIRSELPGDVPAGGAVLEAPKGRDASLALGHTAPPFPGEPDTGTFVPRAGLPGREAKQPPLSDSHRPFPFGCSSEE